MISGCCSQRVVLPSISVKRNVTVPVGVVVGAGDVSVTVAVQLLVEPVKIELGVHMMAVDVERWLTVTEVVPEVAACVPSPL